METISKTKPKKSHHHHHHQRQAEDMPRPPSSNAPQYPTAQPYSGGYPRASSPMPSQPPSSYGAYPAPPSHPSAPHPGHSAYPRGSSPPFGHRQSSPGVGGFIDAQGAPLAERRNLPDPPQQTSPPRVGTASPSAPYRGHTPSPGPATPAPTAPAAPRDEAPAWLAGLSAVSLESVARYAGRMREFDRRTKAEDRFDGFRFISEALDGEREIWRGFFGAPADRRTSVGAVTAGMGGLGMRDRPPQGAHPSSTGPPSWQSDEWRPPYGQHQPGPPYGMSSAVGRMEQAASEYDARPAGPPSGPDNLASYVYGGSGPPPMYESRRQPSYPTPQDPQLYSPPEDLYPSSHQPRLHPESASYGRGPSYSSPERDPYGPPPHRPQDDDYRRRPSSQYPPQSSDYRAPPPSSGYQPYSSGPPSAYPSSPPALGRRSSEYPPVSAKPTSPPPSQSYYGGSPKPPSSDASSYRADPPRSQPQQPSGPQSQAHQPPSGQYASFPAIATSASGYSDDGFGHMINGGFNQAKGSLDKVFRR